MSLHILSRGSRRYALNEVAGNSPTGHTLVEAWRTKVVANGGAAPSVGTVSALNTFCNGMDAAGLTSSMVMMNAFAPDSLTACLTPLIQTGGNNPWTNTGFIGLGTDLSTSGLTGNGSTKYLDTGVNVASALASANNCGLSEYLSSSVAYAGAEAGVYDGTLGYLSGVNWNGVGNSVIGNATNGAYYLTAGYPGSAGYFSINRTSSTDFRLFWANSTHSHQQVGTTNTLANSVGLASKPLLVFCIQGSFGAGTNYFSKSTLAFLAMHSAFNSTQSSAMAGLVQALRTSLGGSV